MKYIIIKIINIYQNIFSPDKGFFIKMGISYPKTCTFYPTCSEYTKSAIVKYGVFKGFYLGVRRILKCHPWQKEHFDPLT